MAYKKVAVVKKGEPVAKKKNTTRSVPVNSPEGIKGKAANQATKLENEKLMKKNTPAGPKYTKTSVAVKNDMDKRKALGKRPS